MIQLNLLPDVKIEFIKAKRLQRIVLFITIITSAAAITVFIILYILVDVTQKNHLASISQKIVTESNQISSNSDVNKIISIQERLSNTDGLPSLYSNRINAPVIFDYLNQVIAKGITIDNVTINYQTGALSFGGKADTLLDGNIFNQQLQRATYHLKSSTGSEINLLQGVIMTGLTSNVSVDTTKNSTSSNKIAYSVTAIISPSLFKKDVNPVINVPNQNVTPSTIDQPKIFTQ